MACNENSNIIDNIDNSNNRDNVMIKELYKIQTRQTAVHTCYYVTPVLVIFSLSPLSCCLIFLFMFRWCLSSYFCTTFYVVHAFIQSLFSFSYFSLSFLSSLLSFRLRLPSHLCVREMAVVYNCTNLCLQVLLCLHSQPAWLVPCFPPCPFVLFVRMYTPGSARLLAWHHAR